MTTYGSLVQSAFRTGAASSRAKHAVDVHRIQHSHRQSPTMAMDAHRHSVSAKILQSCSAYQHQDVIRPQGHYGPDEFLLKVCTLNEEASWPMSVQSSCLYRWSANHMVKRISDRPYTLATTSADARFVRMHIHAQELIRHYSRDLAQMSMCPSSP